MPILLLSVGLLVVAAAVAAVEAVRGIAAGPTHAPVPLGFIAAGFFLGMLTRPFVARWPELAALPRGHHLLSAAELLATAGAMLPVIAPIAVGSLLAVHDGSTPIPLLRGACLAAGCIVTAWSAATRPPIQAGLGIGLGCGIAVAAVAMQAWIMVAAATSVAVVPSVLDRFRRSASLRLPAAATRRGWTMLLVQLAAERQLETVLRVVVAILIAWLGCLVLAGWPSGARAAGLVLCVGAAGLATHGSVHLAAAFHSERRELLDALPISGRTWTLLTWAWPLVLHGMTSLTLAVAIICLGTPWYAAVIGCACAGLVAIVAIAALRRYPENGSLIGLFSTIIAVRILGACLP